MPVLLEEPPASVQDEYVEFQNSFSLPLEAHTHAGFRDWATSDAYPERGRVSFLANEIFIDMSPERLNSHSSIKANILYALMQYGFETNRGIAHGDGVLVTNEMAAVSNEPDASFLLFESLRTGQVVLNLDKDEKDYVEVVGSPDLLVEAVSPSSIRKDISKLRMLYHDARVSEYWLVDARKPAIDFKLLTWTPAGYDTIPTADGWQHSPVLERNVRIVKEELPYQLLRYRVELRTPLQS
jgi:Uma2 family endonuclease